MSLSPARALSNETREMQVQVTTRLSYREAAHVLSRAFIDDPVSVVVYRGFSAGKRVRALNVDFSAELLVCLRRGWPVQVNDGDTTLGAAVIYPPGAYPLPVSTQWWLLIKSMIGNGFYDIRLWMKWLGEVEKHHPSEGHYYLEYIGVEPAKQGRGVGSAILRHLTDAADKEKVGCYLENANPYNLPVYQRHGFQVVDEQEIIGVKTWFMWREPLMLL